VNCTGLNPVLLYPEESFKRLESLCKLVIRMLRIAEEMVSSEESVRAKMRR
jgi:hypothetical protein